MRHQNSVFHDLLKRVPWDEFDRLTKEHKADHRVRRLPTKGQFIALLYGQLSGAASLREIVGGLESHSVRLYHVGGRPVSRSTLADANAAWRRWHDATVAETWSAAEWPWFVALERARVEQLACQHLPGMARNLSDLEQIAPHLPLTADLYRAARDVFAGDTNPQRPIFSQPAGLRQRLRAWQQYRQLALDDTEMLGHLRTAATHLNAPSDFARSLRPLITALSRLPLAANDSAVSADSPGSALMPDPSKVDENQPGEDQSAQPRPGEDDQEPEVLRAFPGYAIFSTAFDQLGSARQWLQAGDEERLKMLMSPDRQQIRRIARKLQRRLQAARLPQWHFDQESGRLDSRRLSRLVSDRTNQHIFRREIAAPMPTACVTFLVDLSGSMRGPRQLIAAMAVDLAVHTLELCGLRCEVLGFTTTAGCDNPVMAQWQQAGTPPQPGRLNALRHIIFKSAHQPWRRMRSGLGLMLREDFGQENIDGEALHWAASRLIRRPEENRILLVLSDGQPYDEATTTGNGRSFLEQHLREVIARIEQSTIRLSAIGAGMNVARFYQRAVAIKQPEALGQALFEQLEALLLPESEERLDP